MTIQPFDYEGQTLRTVDVNGDPWFIAGDVCALLDLGNVGQAIASLDDDEKGFITISDGTPGNPKRAIVSEAGLYSLILRSRKPEAKAIKRWITHDVLPAILRHGAYLTPQTIEDVLADPDTLIRLATDLKAERARRIEADAEVAALTPRAAAWDYMASSHRDWSVQQAAGILARDPGITIGRTRLFKYMEDRGWIFRDRATGQWMAYADRITSRYLAHRAQSHVHPRTGEVVLDPPQVRVTVKGLERLHRMLGGSAPLELDDAPAELEVVG